MEPSERIIEEYTRSLSYGTVIVFEEINDGIRNRVDYIRKFGRFVFPIFFIGS